jgi:hypothetical protein
MTAKQKGFTWVGWTILAYNVIALICVNYGVDVGRGFGGILFDLGMRWFGGVSPRMTAFAGYLILAIPSWIIAVRRIPPGALESSPTGSSPAAPTESGPPWSPARQWLVLLCVSLGLGAIPGLWYVIQDRQEAADLMQPIYQLDLAKSAALPAADAKFVIVRGYQVLDASYEYSKSLQGGGLKESFSYVALVEPGWTEEKPVRYIVDSEWNPDYFPDTLTGRLERNDLPRFIRSGLAEAGVHLASPYYVIRRATIQDGKITSTGREYRYLRWIAIGLALVILLPGGAIVYFRNAK